MRSCSCHRAETRRGHRGTCTLKSSVEAVALSSNLPRKAGSSTDCPRPKAAWPPSQPMRISPTVTSRISGPSPVDSARSCPLSGRSGLERHFDLKGSFLLILRIAFQRVMPVAENFSDGDFSRAPPAFDRRAPSGCLACFLLRRRNLDNLAGHYQVAFGDNCRNGLRRRHRSRTPCH